MLGAGSGGPDPPEGTLDAAAVAQDLGGDDPRRRFQRSRQRDAEAIQYGTPGGVHY